MTLIEFLLLFIVFMMVMLAILLLKLQDYLGRLLESQAWTNYKLEKMRHSLNTVSAGVAYFGLKDRKKE